MTNYLAVEAIETARQHAREVYPRESCGVVVDGTYIRSKNQAKPIEEHEEGNADCGCQLCSFVLDPKLYLKSVATKKLQAIIHSHPGGPLFPSQADMEGQVATNIPWGIVPLDEDRIGDPIMWGDQLPIAPVIGREFMHGISDCYSLVRDMFRLGKDALKEQGIDGWPFNPIAMPEVPRNDEWWKGGQDLYEDGMRANGFRLINISEVRPGDGFLLKVRSEKYNHAGLLLADGTIIHHLPTRLSRREPAGLWGRAADLWVRYEGPGSNA